METVLIVYAPGQKQTNRRLGEELSLIGLRVQSQRGSRSDARAALDERKASVVVFLDGDGVIIWVWGDEANGGSLKEAEVERGEGESSDMLALRSAELLRGQMLAGDRRDDAQGPAKTRAGPFPPADRRVSVTAGPVALFRSYAEPAPGVTADAALWLGPVGLGPYFTVPLLRNDFTATPDPITFRQYNIGGGARLLLLRSQSKIFELQALARLGYAPLLLRRTEGPDALMFQDTADFLSGEAGVEALYFATPWLSFGGQLLGGFDQPLSWPVRDRDLPEQAQAENSSGIEPTTQGHLMLSAVAAVHF